MDAFKLIQKLIVTMLVAGISLGACALFPGAAPGAFAETEGADVPLLTLDPAFGKTGGKAVMYGSKAGNLGKSGGEIEGTVSFFDLHVPADGEYELTVVYASGADDRYFDFTTDFGTYRLACSSTGSFDTAGEERVRVFLKAGGFLRVGSDWYAPDLYRIRVYATAPIDFPSREYREPREIALFEGALSLNADLNNGVYSLAAGTDALLSRAHAEAVVDGALVSSDDFSEHFYEKTCDGKSVTLIHDKHPSFPGRMLQTFMIDDGGALRTTLTVEGDGARPVTVSSLSPTVTYRQERLAAHGVFLQLPFDNDGWAEPKFLAAELLEYYTSGCEAAAFFDEKTGAGWVFGSLDHDLWKSAFVINAYQGDVMGMRLTAGAAGAMTHDLEAHGAVSGLSVSSPEMMIGYFSDWRGGMTAFGRANAEKTPPKPSVSCVPFGYNSWGSMQSSVSYGAMISVSDYIKNNFQDVWASDGAPVYVNIDSYWDYLAKNDPPARLTLNEALSSYVAHCRENGQKAGIYFTPFAAWQSGEDDLKNAAIPGSNYSFYDAALRRSDGTLYGKLDGGWALDPTHPGTIDYVKNRLNYFLDLGFEYVKLDFLSHGALEGSHYDPACQTGMQAYNAGMKQIDELCRGRAFVNLSISPVFPYQYADGRRISCDAFSSLDQTQHVLSCLTACFWEKELYAWPDPDHLVTGGVSEGAARCRVTAGAISGTSFLVGDDLSKVAADSARGEALARLFTNSAVIETAKLGAAFLPLEVTPGARCADVYYHFEDGALYLAVFNFGQTAKTFRVDFSGVAPGLENGAASEAWRGETQNPEGAVLTCTVPGGDAALWRVVRAGDNGEKDPEGGPASDPADPGEKASEQTSPADGAGKKMPAWAVAPIVCGALALTAGLTVLIVRAFKKKKTKT